MSNDPHKGRLQDRALREDPVEVSVDFEELELFRLLVIGV